jgi:hypothetical protein
VVAGNISFEASVSPVQSPKRYRKVQALSRVVRLVKFSELIRLMMFPSKVKKAEESEKVL